MSVPVDVDERARELRALVVPSGGEDVYVEVTGAGPPVVLCHGLGGNHAIWWRQIDSLAARHQLITWDQRGFGNSTARTGAIGIDVAADDLARVLDAADVTSASLVGQSMGAFVVLRFADRYPDRVDTIVISTSLAAAPAEHTLALGGAVLPRRLRDRHAVLSAAFCAEHPDLAVLYNQISGFGTKPPIATMLEAMASCEFTDRQLQALACPVLVLAAELDPLCTPAVMQATSARIPGAEFRIIPSAGHSAYFERPQDWNSAVLNFLGAA